MKKQIISGTVLLWMFLLVAISQAPAADGPELQEIRHSVLAPGAEEVSFRLNGSYSPKIFSLKDQSPRIVVDFPDATHSRGVKSLTETKGSLVKRIRVGMHTEKQQKTRVVLDMTSLDKVTFEQRFDEASSTFFLTLSTSGVKSSPAGNGQKTAAEQPKANEQEPAATPAQPKDGQPAAIGPIEPAPTADPIPAPSQEEKKSAEITPSEKKPLLESVKFDGASSKGEMVMFKLNDFYPPAVHGVEEGTPTVICEFAGMQLADTVERNIKAKGKFVRSIRVSKHKNPDRIKVTLELESNRNYDLQQVFFKDDNLFVIIVNTVKK